MVEKNLTGVKRQQTMSRFFRMLKPNGSILVLYMAWLPFEDRIAGASEKLVLKYNPMWSGAVSVVVLTKSMEV